MVFQAKSIFYNFSFSSMEVSTDYCLPSRKRNSIMAKDTGLIFSLLDVASGVLWHTAVCTMHVPWTYLCPSLCINSFH